MILKSNILKDKFKTKINYSKMNNLLVVLTNL